MRGIYETTYTIDDEDGPRTGFCKVAEASTHYRSFKINSSSVAISFVVEALGDYFQQRRDQERFMIVVLDTKLRPLRIVSITRGTLDASLVHPREVFRPAIMLAASCILLVHNHPSGDPTPSREDYEVTQTLETAGKMLGIQVIDHIVFGDQDAVSIGQLRSR